MPQSAWLGEPQDACPERRESLPAVSRAEPGNLCGQRRDFHRRDAPYGLSKPGGLLGVGGGIPLVVSPGEEPLLEGSEEARRTFEVFAIVAHGGTNRVVLLNAIGAPLAALFNIEQRYACVNIVDYYEDGKAVVNLLNG